MVLESVVALELPCMTAAQWWLWALRTIPQMWLWPCMGPMVPWTGLKPDTDYDVKAYATKSAGTGYGGAWTFTTEPSGVAPNTLLLLDEEEGNRWGEKEYGGPAPVS
ncbi:MAG: hypothetical protein SWQ30_02385 [Thermodesulfobacteriota bacterium]|nr:hypothetical protein [Thermodesulfobacteriota bacterium]